MLGSVKSNKGFSLVELMVVVAIIGILAAIAVPQYQRFTAKSKQAEAKANLSEIYSAERATAAEWTVYDSSWQVIGYRPSGFLNYRIGFSAATGSALPANYAGSPHLATDFSSAAGGYCTGIANNCVETGFAQALPAATVAAGGATFLAAAASLLRVGGVADQWTISQNKQISNIQDGMAGM